MLTATGVGLAVTIPVVIYVVSVWLLHARQGRGHLGAGQWAVPVVVVLILAAGATPQPVLITGALLVGLVAIGLVGRSDAGAAGPNGSSTPA